MNKTKRVFRNFSSYECDEMARYFEYMALKGWHFKGWRIGMEFEQGESKKVCYDVQVFSKGNKYDMKPSEDALDYSEYCKEAGWELVDARAKFCVFRKMREDAIEIVSPEEKLKNIKTIFIEELGQQLFLCFMLIDIGFGGISNFKETMFDTSQVFNFGIGITLLLYLILRLILFMKRMRGYKRELELGIEPFYGKENCDYSKRFTWSKWILEGIVGFLIIICLVLGNNYVESVVMIIVSVLFTLLLSVLRPGREIVNGSIIVFVIIMILVFAGIEDAWTDDSAVEVAKKDAENVQAQMPLSVKDFGVDGYTLKEYEKEENSSIFGTSYHYDLSYNRDVFLDYSVYRSSHNWIMNKIWKETKDDMIMDAMDIQDVTKEWGAKKAYYNGEGYYIVQYPGKQLEIYFGGETLTDNQIKAIREKLDL